jgi:thymidine kinase
MFSMDNHYENTSRLDIVFGPMFCGKTSAILRKLTQMSELGLATLYINHGKDTRSENIFSSHTNLSVSDKISMVKIINLNECNIDLSVFDAIGIDEAQFFGEQIVGFVRMLVEEKGKYVIVGGLDGNFKREKFGNIFDLIPFADNVTKLHAFCKNCSKKKILRPAIFSKYTSSTNIICSDGINIGGAEKYEPVCRSCFKIKP